MKLDTWPNLVAMFFDQAAKYGDKPFLWDKRDGTYVSTSWREAADEVRGIAKALTHYGLGKGDRVVLLSENAPRWGIADFAIMAAGGVSVPAYTTNTARDHAHILTDSGATMALVSTATLAAPLLEAAKDAPALSRVIAIEAVDVAAPSHVTLNTWDQALADGAKADGTDPEAASAGVAQESLACLIYTSGTGGVPKGVMLSHRAMMANCVGAYELLETLGLGDEVFLSFLPLSHSYEHSAGLMFPVAIGAQIYYAEGVETLTTNLAEVRPTLMTAVPRLYEVMRQRILAGVKRQRGLKAKLFWHAVELGRKRYEDPASLGLGDRMLDGLVERLVRSKVRDRFGGRLKALVSGGAPLNYEIGLFFTALGLRLLQGYGQTEAAPVVSCNPPTKNKLHTVGPAVADAEVKFADDGEILVRGPLLMDGYWNHPDLTAETLRDGWLHTGDIGEIDEDGYIQITDRKKDIIVVSGGDNVSPQRVEGMLTLEPEIEQAMVIGDQRPHLVGLLVPGDEFSTQWKRDNDFAGSLSDNADFKKVLSDAVDRANDGLSVIEKVKRFVVTDEAFTVDNEMMTPTMKVRRKQILERYGDQLEALYTKAR
jgi:long-chain acyl-CoA synthetase